MRLSKLAIKHFRGIQSLEINLDRDMTVLIGENNSGKTSVMEALRFGLDAVKSDKTCNFTEYDFYRDNAYNGLLSLTPIELTYSFIETEDYLWPDHITQTLNDVIVGSDYSTIKLRLSAFYDNEEGGLVQRWFFLDDLDNELVGKQSSIRDLRKLRPFFFQTALRAAKDEFHGQSTYWSSFLKNKDIDDDTKKRLEKELFTVNKKIVNAHSSFVSVTDEVKKISALVSAGGGDSVSVDPVPPDVYKSLRYTEINLLTGSEAKIPIRSHGEGTQSLSVLLLFSAYLKSRLQADIDQNAEPIIAIEEPEAHLHPNAIRAIWHILSELPGQKIIATHSGDILSEVPLANLRKMTKQGRDIYCKNLPDGLLTPEELRKFNHHVRRNRGELLFAKFWLLVEGETDVSVFSESAELLSIDLHRNGVRIVECSQAGGPGIFIKVADALNINWHLVADDDQGGQKYVNDAKTLLNGRTEVDYISTLPYSNIDILLCYNGYGQPYLNGVGPNKMGELTAPVNSLDYWKQVYKVINKARGFSKPAAALEAILLMKNSGPGGVHSGLKTILTTITTTGGGTL